MGQLPRADAARRRRRFAARLSRPAVAVLLGTLNGAADETLTGTTIVIAGDAVVAGRTQSPLVVVGGDARIEGRADDDVVAVLGNVKLAPGSVAARDVVAAGGRVLRADD